MKSSLQRASRGTRVAAGAAFALLVLVAVIVDRTTNVLRAEVDLVRHTYDVIGRLDALENAIGDSESARRAYALTADRAYVRALDDAKVRAFVARDALRTETRDNASQQARLDELDRLLAARLGILDEAVRARATSFDADREAVTTRTGEARGVELRAVIAQMDAEERGLLAERRANGNRTLASLRFTQVIAVTTSIGLLGWAFLRMRRETSARARSEAALATTLHSIADAVIAIDREGKVTRMNAVAEKLTGWKADDARGRPASEVARVRADEARGGAVLVSKDGDERPVLESKAPISGDDRADVDSGTVVVFHDVTKLRAAEDEQRRLNAFLDSIIENLPLMVFVKEAGELRFERLNRAGEELLGLSRDAMLGKNDFDFFPEEQARAFVATDRGVLDKGVVVDVEEEPIDTKRGRVWLHTKKVPLFAENGEPAYLLGISEDITDRKRAAEELRTAKDALEASNRELESFSYSVAHDLRAPLRAIGGFSQVLVEDYAEKLDDEAKNYLARIQAGATRMGELIDDLLQLSRLTRAETRMQRVDVSALASTIAEGLRERYPQAEVRVGEGLAAEADAGFVRVALENLLDNALKFSSKTTAPVVELGVKDGAFFVRDNGVGFDVGAAKNLFGAFQRFHKPSEFKGTGIGLATVQRVVRRHGGRIWAESAPGQGTTFFFTLGSNESGGRT